MAEHILVVDDDEFMRASLQMELEAAGYKVTAAENGYSAIELAKKETFDLVVTDVRMPGMSGIDALSAIREFQPMAKSIVITGYASPDAPVSAIKMRVDDYLMKPFSSEDFLKSVHISLERYRQHSLQDSSRLRFRESFVKLLMGIFAESRFSYLVGHSERVAGMALAMARELGFSPQRTQSLYLASLLHDIGIVELPAPLLEKSELMAAEYELIKNHPILARDLLAPFKELREIATMVLHHHERWEGGGYPSGLTGEKIPIESRIIAIAETFDSLTNERPYRKKLDRAEALAHIGRESARSFDPALVKAFTAVMETRLQDGSPAPLPLLIEGPAKATFLLNIAHTYAQMGNSEVARAAFASAEELLREEVCAPELMARVKFEKIHLLARDGKLKEALEEARAALEFAKEQSLQFAFAQITLFTISLRMKERDFKGLAEELAAVRETFHLWESAYDICVTDLFSSALQVMREEGPGGQASRFEEHLKSFLLRMEGGRFYDVMTLYGDLVYPVVRHALEKDILCDVISRVLSDESEPGVLPLIEKLIGADHQGTKLKVLDILSAMKGKGALELLSRAANDSDPAVAKKSSLLISKSPLEKTEAVLQVYFLGKFRVAVNSEPIDEDIWDTRKTRNLFSYLASRRGEVINEEKLMELFWSQGGDKARHSLYNAISQIRKIFTPLVGIAAKTIIQKRKDGYLFNKKLHCWVDIEEFDEHYHRGKYLADQGKWDEALLSLQRAERLYGGPFLEGSYEEWSDSLRFKLQTKFLEILQIMAHYFFDKKKYKVSIDYWKTILNWDNCFEDAYLGLMMCHYALEKNNEAIRIYHECTQTLKKELDLAPPPRIMEFYLKMIHGEPVELTL
ncbi:MAG: response regulator [Candidatus Eremiobacteraeota bacterium]|nr:response regulator [Candidatus Eremiobacteraeota bacterium]